MTSSPACSTTSCGIGSPITLAGATLHLPAAKSDPSAFVEFCFADPAGNSLQQAPVHRELQAFLTAHRKALIELPRDHGKSVQVCGRVVWELGHNPALRVKLVCATDALAAERTRFLRDAIANNPRVRLVFPDLQPAEPWAADSFTVRRPADAIGPTVAAFGLGSGATGARADLLVCDDVVDVKSLHSKAERDRAADTFSNNLWNLLEPDGRFWGLSTPWHPDDLNARLKANGGFPLFRRAVGPDLEPVWPAKWPRDKLAERLAEVGAAAFARGYRLTAFDEQEVAVRPEWVRVWVDELPRDRFEAVVLAVDPAVSVNANADASALVVLGRVVGSNEVRVLEAGARRVSTPELVELIGAADQRWRPDAILFEANVAFAGIRDLLIRHARFGPRVKGEPAVRGKAARVAALSVPVQNGTVRLKGDAAGRADAGQRGLWEELTTFPFAAHDDQLDALAAGVEYLLGRPAPRVWV
jgi:phage terminase large subunit-like protein